MKSSTIFKLSIGLAFLVAMYFALSGVDYGAQWDQNNIKGFVNKYVRTGNILPGEYHYPPGSSYVATTTIIPYVIPFIQRYGLNWVPTQHYLLDEVLKNPNQGFLLNLRRVFVFATILAVLWTGLAAGQRQWLAGAVAAAALAFSWEVSYQSRIVHPDGPTMQFVALSLLFAMLAFYKKKPLDYRIWLGLAAVAAAMATATKYTAGISIFVVLLFAYLCFAKEKALSRRKMFLNLSLLVLLFVGAFIAFVPGAVLETPVFIEQVVRDQEIYASGYGFQTVNAGLDYLVRVVSYLFQAAFSHNRLLALVFPTFTAIGIYALIKSRKKDELVLALALAGIPLLYILFLATHRALFVRNLLFLFPSLAILSGFGFSWLFDRLRSYAPTWRYALVGLLLLVLGVNTAWLAHTASTIRARGTNAFAQQAVLAIAKRTDQTVYITPAAQRLLGDVSLPPNVVSQFNGDADLVLFAYRGDTLDEHEGGWPVNFPGASPEIFGSMDINMDWYASWPGVERLVLASPDLAWQDGANVKLGATEPMAGMSSQQISGTLTLDGEQFTVEAEDGTRNQILNSANPKLIIALMPLLDAKISATGIPYSQGRLHDFFLTSVNGEQVLSNDELKIEFNFTRFFENLSESQRGCVATSVGEETYQALTDTLFNVNELPVQQLQQIADCVG